MRTFSESELRELFACYTVPEPPDELIERTTEHLYREQMLITAVPTARAQWILILTGLALAMTLCLFYTLTVGSVIRLFVPGEIAYYLRQSVFVFTAAGTSLLSGIVMVLVMRHFAATPCEEPVRIT